MASTEPSNFTRVLRCGPAGCELKMNQESEESAILFFCEGRVRHTHEAHCDKRLHLDGFAVDAVWLVSPLFDGIESRAPQEQRTANQLQIADYSIFAY